MKFSNDHMDLNDNEDYSNLIYTQVSKSFSKLTDLMGNLANQQLIQHCKIWVAEKGVRKLIEAVIEGDKLLSQHFQQQKKVMNKNSNSRTMKPTHKIQRNRIVRSHKKIQDNPKISNFQEDSSSQKFFQLSNNKIQHVQQQNIKINEQEPLQKPSQMKLQNQPSQIIKKEQDLQIHFFSSDEDIQGNVKKPRIKSKRSYERGPYIKYSRQIKERMVQLYRSNTLSISKISSQYGVPIKNIKRWSENGVQRKEGAGRKRMDPLMQSQLFRLIIQKYPAKNVLKTQRIRALALSLSKIPDFKASKGWIMSFISRFNLSEIYEIV